MIDMSKKYRTRDGRDVRIYAVDGAEEYPVHGAVFKAGVGWFNGSWSESGQSLYGIEPSPGNLVEVKAERWIWQFDCGMFVHVSHGTQERCESWHKAGNGQAVRFVQEDENSPSVYGQAGLA
jgi:hypothetical protein